MALYHNAEDPAAASYSTEFDILKATHKFLREDADGGSSASWNEQLAQKYYSSLFREFAVCDLKHYKSGNVCSLLTCSKEKRRVKLLYSLPSAGVLNQRSFPVLERLRAATRVVRTMLPRMIDWKIPISLLLSHLRPSNYRLHTRSTARRRALW
jgi:Folate-sensitive fragile site protein Fra10Ac1